jgi:branched-chain amino acid transport system permease protein/urea transport system permease protein
MDHILIAGFDAANAMLVLMLVSLGLAIIFGLMNVINMAHGEFLVIGAYGMVTLTGAGIPFWLALPLAALVVAAVGLLVEEVLIQRTYKRALDSILATTGLSLALRQAIVLIYGPGSYAVSAPALGEVSLGGSPYPVYRLVVMAIALVSIAVTLLLFFRTRFGLTARATIANRSMAAALGVNTRFLDRATFSLGAFLAGLAGATIAPLISVDPSAGLGWLTPGFLAVLVGGVGSLTGPLAGSAFVGFVDSSASALYSPIVSQIAVLIGAIALIRMFPRGLLARKRRES